MKDRTLKILRTFITLDYPIPLEKLEDQFRTSSRTIRNELREINQFLIENNFSEIKNFRNRGYQLVLDASEKQALLEQSELVNEEFFWIETSEYSI